MKSEENLANQSALIASVSKSYRQGLGEDTLVDLDDFVETDSQHRVAMDDLSVRLRIFIIKYRGHH